MTCAEAERILRTLVDEVHVEPNARQLTAPANGLADVTRIAGAFDGSGIELDDLGLKRPSLDDVFLHLTGHRAEDATEPDRRDPGSDPVTTQTDAPTAPGSPAPRSATPASCGSRCRSPAAISSTSSGCPRCCSTSRSSR